MKYLAIFSAAALATALPGTGATQTSPSDGDSASEQKSARDSWPPDRQRAYEAWPGDVKAYFWTLSPDEQAGWWLLTDVQRAKIYAMTPEQRAQAWVVINKQLAEARGASTGSSAVRSQDARVTNWVSNPVVQQIAADQAVYDGGEIPICNENEFDNCINAWEAGKRGPGVDRPLDYWPGES